MTQEEVNAILERYDQTAPELQRQILVRFVEDRAALALALDRLIALYHDYAQLLNNYDDGRRMDFPNRGVWLLRLAELGRLPEDVARRLADEQG